jgi:hypothetical protein
LRGGGLRLRRALKIALTGKGKILTRVLLSNALKETRGHQRAMNFDRAAVSVGD